MKVVEVKMNEPKTETAAQNQAVYVLEQLEHCAEKRGNIMKNLTAAREKIEKLKKKVTEFEDQISAIDRTEENWRNAYSDLFQKYNLVEAEILELRSAVLRQRIAELQKKAGIEETGKSTFV